MLNIITFNVNGLASSDGRVSKRRKLFTWLKTHHCDIALLQETHCTDSMQRIWAREWGGDIFFSNGSSDSRGVCILIRRGLDLEIKEVRKDDQGRLIFLKAVLNGKSVLFGSIYCPNRDEIDSIMCVNDWLSLMLSDHIIIAGDFNLTLDPARDREGEQQESTRDYCRRRSRALKETLEEFRLVDVWRKQNPDASQFTFARGASRSRLDYFFISEHLCFSGTGVECSIMPPYLADHRAVQLKVDLHGQVKGPGYWKFNNSLLVDENFVEELRAFINEALLENDTPGVSRALLFDTVLCMVRGKIIQYASMKKREKDERLHELENFITANSDTNTNDEQLQRAIEERDEIIENKTKSNMFRCKVNWAAYAEKSSSYFFSLEQRKARSRAIPALFLNHVISTGELSNKTEQMLDECTSFYSKLYKRVSRAAGCANSFLETVETITESQREECDIQLTAEELTASLSSLKPNTAPGPDGWTAEFFRKFWDIFCPLLLGVANEIFDSGSFPDSFSRSVTTLIPKKGKDKRYIENLRPISLLPVPYKIIAKVMALRLKKVVGSVIHADQTGFLTGRNIGENIRLIVDLMELADRKQINGILMQCDFLKAYDSISWDYVNEVIRAYGFGPNFQRWMMIFYPAGAMNARINVNNFLSPQFNVERGIRQGCPLSCLIWLLCMEPLLNRIRKTDAIRGITVSETEIKLSAYADDLTLILDGSEPSLRNVITVFDDFNTATGLKLNMSKTICTWIGRVRYLPPICQDLNMQWLAEGGALDVLGVKVFADAQRTRNSNYSQKLKEMEETMSPWLQRSLTPLGRVILVKSLLLAKFVHLFAAIENPDKAYMAKLESLLFKFIWGKKDKIKRGIAKRQFLEGGIAAPDVESFASALKISWIRRWLDTKESSWKLLVNEKFIISNNLNIFQCAIGELQIRNLELPEFWNQVLKAWAHVKHNSSGADDFMAQPLLLNRSLNIELSLSPQQLRTLKAHDIMYVKQLYNFRSRKWITAREMMDKWNYLGIMTCNQLVSSIPREWRSAQRRDQPVDGVSMLQALISAESPTKWAYKTLVSSKLSDQCSCESKWMTEFGSSPDWRITIKNLTESSKNIELRWLQFRILHKILPTRKMLKIFKLVDNDQCVFCKEAVETDLHLFVHCSRVKTFWDIIWRAFKRCNRKYQSTILTPRQIMFGVEKNRYYDLNLFILLAKSFIWKQSKNNNDLSIRMFLKYLMAFRNVQSCVYELNDKKEEFRKLWKATEKTVNALKVCS